MQVEKEKTEAKNSGSGENMRATVTVTKFTAPINKKQLILNLQQVSYKDCIPKGFEFKYDFVSPNNRRDRSWAINNAIVLLIYF